MTRHVIGAVATVVVVFGTANFFLAGSDDAGLLGVPLYVSHPLMMLALPCLLVVYLVPFLIGTGRRLPAPAGEPRLVARARGRIGPIWFPAGTLRLRVYHDRLVVHPLLLAPHTILGTEIVRFEPGYTDGVASVRVFHGAPGTKHPIALPRESLEFLEAIDRGDAVAAENEPATWNGKMVIEAFGMGIAVVLTIVGIVLVITTSSVFYGVLALAGAWMTYWRYERLQRARP